MRFHPPDFFCPDHHPPIAFDMITSANSIYDPSTIIDQSPRITASVTTTRQDDDDELYLCIDGQDELPKHPPSIFYDRLKSRWWNENKRIDSREKIKT